MMRTCKLCLMLIFLLLCILPQVFGFSDVESFARVRATVVGFEPEAIDSSFITLKIEEVLDYSLSPGSDAQAPRSGYTYTFGYLWGHSPVISPFKELSVGSEIEANVSFHHKFTSHVGHLYWYQLVCAEDELLTDDGCAPQNCANNEVLVGIKCVPLECGPSQGYRNHTCYDLECETDEKVEEHRCKGLVCAEDEFAANHYCQKLDCGINEVAREHKCVPLVCGVFRKAGNQTCVLDGSQLILFVVVSFIVLYLIYTLLIQDIFSDRKKGDKLLANSWGILLVFLVSLVVLSLPSVSRLIFHSNLLIGSESYHNQFIASRLIDGTLYPEIFGDASFYPLLLAYLGGIFGLDLVAHLLPILLGAFSATIFYLIIRKLITDVRMSTLTAILLVFSPAYLYLFSTSTPDGLVTLMLLMGIYLALSSRKLSILSGGAILAIASSYNPFVFALSFAAYLLILINTKNNKKLRLALLAFIVLSGMLFSLFLHTYTKPITSFREGLIAESITDLGGVKGFGIFQILLLLAGLLYTWKEKKAYAPIYILLGLVFGLMLVLDRNYNTYLNFVVVYFVGYALSKFSHAKWETQELKNIALLILFCGLLFSTVSYAKRLSLMGPEPELAGALTKLSEYPKGTVLSFYAYSDYIAYFSDMSPYIDERQMDAASRKSEVDRVFASRNLETTRQFMDNEDITYIVVDRAMRQGEVWKRENQGMLFLFRNPESFRRLYGREVDVEVWEYTTPTKEIPSAQSGQAN